MGQIPTWLVEDGEGILLGVFTGEAKAQAAATAAEGAGYGDVTVSPYPANARLWTEEGAASLAGLEAHLDSRASAQDEIDAEESARIDAEASRKAQAIPVPQRRRKR